jgi:hypothetical protein
VAKKRGRGDSSVNKSKFIRDLLEANKSISWAEVRQKWEEAGNAEKLNPTLYYHACKKLGITRGGRRRGRKPGRKAGAAVVESMSAASTGIDGLKKVERKIDDLIAELGVGFSDVAAKLADARRVVSYRIVKSGG